MLIHRKPGRFRAAIAVVLLAVAGLATVSASTPPAAAAADADCAPIFATPPGFGWATRTSERGVSLCFGSDQFGVQAYVQIVDLAAGAKVRMIADNCDNNPGFPDCGSFSDTVNFTDIKGNVKSAGEWFDWIRSGANSIGSPDSSRLFSTSNASFFTDTSGGPTPFSLPFHNLTNCCFDGPDAYSGGWALAHHEDPAWDSPKMFIKFDDPRAARQQVTLGTFPTHYTHQDFNPGITSFFPFPFHEQDVTVGFTPDFDGGTGRARRTFVGVSSDALGFTSKVYILNSNAELTVGEAQNILRAFGSEAEIQLDGGGSTQMFADTTLPCCFSSPILRKVPNVLAVYLAP